MVQRGFVLTWGAKHVVVLGVSQHLQEQGWGINQHVTESVWPSLDDTNMDIGIFRQACCDGLRENISAGISETDSCSKRTRPAVPPPMITVQARQLQQSTLRNDANTKVIFMTEELLR